MASSIGIIGAGITGLTLARNLYERGIDFTLYEKSSQPGGVMRSYREGDWLAEAGPHTFLVKSPRVESFLQATDIASRRVFASGQATKRYIVRDGELHAVPTGLLSLLKTKLFSARAKFRLLKEPFVSKVPAERDESIASFVRRRLGPEFLDYAVNPFVAGVYSGDPERLSLRHAFPRMHALEQEYGSLFAGQLRRRRDRDLPDNNRIFSFPEGLGQLPELLSTPLKENIHYETEITTIQKERDGTWALTCTRNHESFTRRHSTLICTVPLHRLNEISFKIEAADRIQVLNDVSYPPVSVWSLGFHRSQIDPSLDGFGMLLPEKERRNILGTLFTSSLFPRRAPEDHVMLATFAGGARQPQIARKSDEEQKSLILRDLHDLLGLTGKPAFEHVYHWPNAIPQYETGYSKINSALETLEKENDRLLFAGNFRDGASINDCMRYAIQLSEKISGE